VNLHRTLTLLDWIIFFSILLITAASVLYGQSRKKKNLNDSENYLDLLLMGRQLTLPLFIATLVATWYGGIFGVTRIAFEKGIFNFITQGVFWYLAYLVFAFFMINKIAPYKAVTLPDLIGKMFGPKSAKLSAVFNFFNVLPIAYTISLGLFLQMLFGIPILFGMILGTSIVVLYSIWGGFRAVVYSDLVQFFVMCTGVVLVLFYSISTFGGLDFLKLNLPAKHFSLTSDQGLWGTLVWGFIALATLVDPNFYQRCFAARSKLIAKRGIILSTCIWFIFDICTTAGAMYARAVMPEAESAYAYMLYALSILPDGLRGFFLAGILATILSTMDSYLFLAGTSLSYDLAPKRWKGRLILHYIGIMTVAILSVVIAYVFEGNIKQVWKILGSYFAACLLLPVLAGHGFPGRIRDQDFILSSLLGIISVTAWQIWQPWAIDALYIGSLTTGLSLFLSCTMLNTKQN
jgi:solute:Na+ symporter, SSS family